MFKFKYKTNLKCLNKKSKKAFVREVKKYVCMQITKIFVYKIKLKVKLYLIKAKNKILNN